MRVSTIMSAEPRSLTTEDTLESASRLMEEQRIRHVPVLDHERVVGVLSDRDLLEVTGGEEHNFVEDDQGRPRIARDYMRVPAETASPEEDLRVATERLLRWGVGCLPVVADGRLVGLLSETDLLTAFAHGRRDGRIAEIHDPQSSSLMSRDVVSVESTSSVSEAVETCRAEGIRHLPVVADGWFVGIISDRDLRMWARRDRLEGKPVGEIMSREIISIAPDAPLSAAAALMAERRIGAVTVARDGKLEGILTATDVLHHMSSLEWVS